MSLGAPRSERGRSQGQGLLFRGDRQGIKRSAMPVRRMAGEPKPFRAATRKQKTAVLQGAARLLFAVKRSSARETTGRQGRTETMAVEPFSKNFD